MPGSQRRQRRTQAQGEAERLATALAITLGANVRQERRRQHRTQRQLAADLGIDQARISQIERGRGGQLPLELWLGLGVVLRRSLAITFSKPIDPNASTPDAGHLQIQEALLALAAQTGRRAAPELPTRPLDPRHSTDVAIRADQQRVLILAEAWNTFGDVGAAIRSTHRKQAEAADLAVVLGGDGGAYRVATVWVVSATVTNRRLIARYPNLFAATFPGSSLAWVRALTTGTEPPSDAGLVWFDAATGHIRVWRRAAREPG